MKQKNLTILSLLTSLMLLVFAGSALANVTVSFTNATFDVGRTGQTIEMKVTADNPITMFDVVAEIASAGAWGTITGANFTLANGTGNHDFSRMDGQPDDIFRLYATNLGSCDPVLNSGTGVVFVTLTIDIGCSEGTFTITPTGINWNIDAYTTATTTFVGAGCAAETVTGQMGTFTVQDNAPHFTNCPTADLVFGCNEPAHYDFDADDADLGFCSEALAFAMVPGNPGSINTSTGAWTWNSVGLVGPHSVSVKVTDSYGKSATCTFTVVITNLAPVVDYCPPGPNVPFDGVSLCRIAFGDLAYGAFTGHDQDVPACPGPMEYVPIQVPAGFVVDANTGDWQWQTTQDASLIGDHNIILGITDQADTTECEFVIRVTGMRIGIGKTGEGEFVFQGGYTEVPIYAFVDGQDVGGFDFLITYDASALTLIEATLGSYLVDADWEYFTYKTGPFGTCGGQCPDGLVRIIGINDVNNGQPHPDWPASWYWGSDSVVIANLKFYVTDDRNYECQYIPIGFYWLDCGDNSISDSTGVWTFVSRDVYWFNRPNFEYLLLDPASSPYRAGWQSIPAPFYQDCPNLSEQGKPSPLPYIDFYYGGVDIACADTIDLRGDLNLNNISNEIGDAVLYSNYFIYGQSVFNINLQGQVAASDVNGDGKVLTVGDLVYLIRIITGDAAPYAKLAPFANSANVALTSIDNGLAVSTNCDVDLGAALFVFNNAGGSPEVIPAISGMEVKSGIVDNQLRVLVYDMHNSISAGNNNLFTVVGDVGALVDVSIVDYYGADMNVNTYVKAVPTKFALQQNSPNPFNPSTDIALDLPVASQWTVDIYNVNGQLVKSFSGYDNAGRVTVTWNANGMASGIYLYRATAGNFTDVRKMVLMK